MWHKLLLVMVILLVGCSKGGDLVAIETQPEISSAVKTGPENTPTLDSTSPPAVDSQSTIPLTNLGPAPELTNEVWLNTDQPLRLADLKGNVVLLEMWTFG